MHIESLRVLLIEIILVIVTVSTAIFIIPEWDSVTEIPFNDKHFQQWWILISAFSFWGITLYHTLYCIKYVIPKFLGNCLDFFARLTFVKTLLNIIFYLSLAVILGGMIYIGFNIDNSSGELARIKENKVIEKCFITEFVCTGGLVIVILSTYLMECISWCRKDRNDRHSERVRLTKGYYDQENPFVEHEEQKF